MTPNRYMIYWASFALVAGLALAVFLDNTKIVCVTDGPKTECRVERAP